MIGWTAWRRYHRLTLTNQSHSRRALSPTEPVGKSNSWWGRSSEERKHLSRPEELSLPFLLFFQWHILSSLDFLRRCHCCFQSLLSLVFIYKPYPLFPAVPREMLSVWTTVAWTEEHSWRLARWIWQIQPDKVNQCHHSCFITEQSHHSSFILSCQFFFWNPGECYAHCETLVVSACQGCTNGTSFILTGILVSHPTGKGGMTSCASDSTFVSSTTLRAQLHQWARQDNEMKPGMMRWCMRLTGIALRGNRRDEVSSLYSAKYAE